MGNTIRRRPGIYMITCTTNRKVYIGSCNKLSKRRMQHYNRLRNGQHNILDLQNDYNLYTEECIVYSILERCNVDITNEGLLVREAEWVRKFNALDSRYGYNTKDPVTGKVSTGEFANIVHTKELIDEVGYLSEGTDYPFIRIDCATGELDLFMSFRLLRKVSTVHESAVRRCLLYWDTTQPGKGDCARVGGYIFVYAEQYRPGFDYIGYRRNKTTGTKISTPKVPIPMEDRALCYKEVVMTHIESGTEKIYKGVGICIRGNGFKGNKVYGILRGQGQTHRGYTFRYTGN